MCCKGKSTEQVRPLQAYYQQNGRFHSRAYCYRDIGEMLWKAQLFAVHRVQFLGIRNTFKKQ